MLNNVKVVIRGASSLMTHNIRLANPMDPYTKKLKELTAKKKPTDEQLFQIMRHEARAGCWDTPDELFAVNNAAVLKSVIIAARISKEGAKVERGVTITDGYTPVEIDGEFISCDELLKDPTNIDYRSVRIGQARIMRARPKIDEGWEAEFVFGVETTVIDLDRFIQLLVLAGKATGLGEMRTRGMGRYEVLSANLMDAEAESEVPVIGIAA